MGNLALIWQIPFVRAPPKFAYPAIPEFHFPGCIAVQLWFYNMILQASGISFFEWVHRTTKSILPRCREDFRLADTFRHDPPPIRWSRKGTQAPRIGRSWKLLAALAALNQTVTQASVPFQLSTEIEATSRLRKFRSYQGALSTEKLSPQDLAIVHRRIRASTDVFSQATSNNRHVFSAVVDSGCTHSSTNKFSDCDPTTIRRLKTPMTLGGIAGGLQVNYVGRATWETIDDLGNVTPFPDDVFIHEDLPSRLLSPQAFLAHHKDGTRTGRLQDHFSIFRDRCEWHLRGRKLITLGFDQSYLPRLTLFTSGKAVSTLQALNTTVHDSNKNMSPLKKLWLRWHIKLGHIGFSHVQKLALGGFLDRISLGLLRTQVSDYPRCASCQYGKQKRTPDPTTTVTKNQELIGSLKENQLTPGDRIFCDQLESRVQGRLMHTAGREPDKDRYCGATIFCDAASGYIHAEFQVTLNATDSINALDNFERVALHQGVDVKSYHTDNGIFKSKRFVHEIMSNAKTIRYSGVGAKWQNGVAESAIGLVSSTARTNMIHAALHWPEVEDAALWPLAVQHAIYMYNHTPNPSSGIAPIEIFSRTISDCQALRNAHPWGAPVYVLQPRLTSAGGKLPKWQPRSRRGQFVGISPVHAETIGLVRNLTTGYISPQYHLVYDDWFETVYSSLDHEPPEWNDLCTFQRFETYFDEGSVPTLRDEWLTPAEIETSQAEKRLHGLRQGRKRDWQHASDKDSREDFTYEPPAPDPLRLPPDPNPSSQTREPSSPTSSVRQTREPPPSATRQLPSSWNRQTRDDPTISTSSTTVSDRPARHRPPNRPMNIGTTKGQSYHMTASAFNRKSFTPSSFLSTAIDRFSGLTPSSSRMLHAQMLGYDPTTGLQEYLPPGLTQSCVALKAKASTDPDLPTLRESLTGPYSEEFWIAMDAEIASLESKGTWEVVPRSSLPTGTKAVPGTWVQRIKRLPSGELSKFKSRWCCRGDLQPYEGVAYTPLVGWPTVRTALLMASAQGWTSRQVDFTLAFCQSPQPADNPLYMELPQYYKPAGFEGQDVILKLKKSIYGQVDSPKLFYEHLCRGMHTLGFRPSESDPCLFIHTKDKVMVLNYCDDQIWLSPDNQLIEGYVSKLKELGYDLELEEKGDIFGFLGIEFKLDGTIIHLSQTGLIEKVIKYTKMTDATGKSTPAAVQPLGRDADGEPFSEDWSYSAAVGMLLYLSSNSRPDLTFATSQVARFSHSPKKSHGQALKRIIRYLIVTSEQGIRFQPKPRPRSRLLCRRGF